MEERRLGYQRGRRQSPRQRNDLATRSYASREGPLVVFCATFCSFRHANISRWSAPNLDCLGTRRSDLPAILSQLCTTICSFASITSASWLSTDSDDSPHQGLVLPRTHPRRLPRFLHPGPSSQPRRHRRLAQTAHRTSPSRADTSFTHPRQGRGHHEEECPRRPRRGLWRGDVEASVGRRRSCRQLSRPGRQ